MVITLCRLIRRHSALILIAAMLSNCSYSVLHSQRNLSAKIKLVKVDSRAALPLWRVYDKRSCYNRTSVFLVIAKLTAIFVSLASA